VKVNIALNWVSILYVAVTRLYECCDEHSGCIKARIFFFDQQEVSS
jgi:hypothetical protein